MVQPIYSSLYPQLLFPLLFIYHLFLPKLSTHRSHVQVKEMPSFRIK